MRGFPVAFMALAAALASCRPTDSAPPLPADTGEATAASSPRPVAPQVTSLAGDWRVAGIDGADFNEPYGLALKGDSERLWWEPICALQARRYRIAGGTIVFSPPSPPPRPGEPPPPVCLIAAPARLADVMRALDTAQTVERTPQNGILIAGGGHSLLLFSQ
uniref:hypothetical protein n=1 Tax=Altererythrobacter segetis TaxID=1104773 RepID=UPI00140AA820|nr:hypothetical protein [Altererythrobacter segetis]